MVFRGPTHVDFNLTNGCNLACSHCHSSSGPRLDNELKTDEIISAINQLHEIGTLKIAFAGGEPFTRKDIFEILSHACSLSGWTVSVITNGFYLNSLTLDRLKKECPNLVINISIDGSTPQNYSILRKQVNRPNADPTPLFNRVITGIKEVVSSGLSNSINFTITKATIADIIPTYNLAINQLGADSLVGIKFFPGGYGKEHLDLFEIPYKLWDKEFSKLTKMKLNGELSKMQMSVPAPWEFYLPLISNQINIEEAETAWGYKSPLRQKYYFRNRNIGDVAGVAELCVSSDGTTYPSVLFVGENDMVSGNIRESSLEEIWSNSKILKQLRSLDITNIDGNCSNCGIQNICGGGSRSRSYSGSQHLSSSDYMCPIVKSEVMMHA